MGIKKPQICQAGSAEALIDSTATGRELYLNYTKHISVCSRKNFENQKKSLSALSKRLYMTLGRLQKIDLRQVWNNEAGDFPFGLGAIMLRRNR